MSMTYLTMPPVMSKEESASQSGVKSDDPVIDREPDAFVKQRAEGKGQGVE